MNRGGLTVIRQKVLPLEVVEVVKLRDFHLKKDLTFKNRLNLFYIKICHENNLKFCRAKFFLRIKTVNILKGYPS
jgi:hypothetical protein